MKTQIFLIGLLSAFALNSFARILLVSDIDDTIKISNVKDSVDATENLVLLQNHFTGMSELYQTLAHRAPVDFTYVTNAPGSMMTSAHTAFLAIHQFPQGHLYLKESLFQNNFKLVKIPQLIREKKPDSVILVGDNGEQDPIVYSQIQNMFPQIPMLIYIHQVYSVKSQEAPATGLRLGEIPYVTSVDLAGELQKAGLIAQEDVEQFASRIVPKVLDEPVDAMSGELAFPAWMNCQDYRPQLKNETGELMQHYQAKLKYRCNFR